MAESKPAVSKSTMVFVAGLCVGLVVGGVGGVYIGTSSETNSITIPKPGAGKSTAPKAPRDETPAAAPEGVDPDTGKPAAEQPEAPKQGTGAPSSPASPK